MTLKILIVDDEPLARRRIGTMLRESIGVQIVGEAESGEAALDMIGTLSPDVVLLDVKMPGMDGFELLERIEDSPMVPVVIFITAFNHYAVRAFDVSAVDYLLKPVAFDRLRSALDRARTTLATRDADSRLAEMSAVITALRSNAAEGRASRRFERELWVRRRGEFVRVPVETIDWIEAERDYIRLHVERDSLLMRETMSAMEGRLDPAAFIRVHRSAIVRRDLVTAIRQAGYGATRVALSNGVEVPIGRTYTARVREILARRDLAA